MSGYFGVIIPKYNFWQGYFLPESLDESGKEFLAATKLAIGGRYMPPSAVISALGEFPDEVQPWIGALSACIVEYTIAGLDVRAGMAAAAIRILTGYNYFYVVGDKEHCGSLTSVYDLPDAKSDADARNAINLHPLVLVAKLNLLMTTPTRKH